MTARGFGEGLADEGHGEEEPAKWVAAPLGLCQYTIVEGRKRALTASGCFQGHDKLLSIAPIVAVGVGPTCLGVFDRLVVVMGSRRPYGSIASIECLV